MYALHISCAPRDGPRSKSANLVRPFGSTLSELYSKLSPSKGMKFSINFDPCVRFVTSCCQHFRQLPLKQTGRKICPRRNKNDQKKNTQGIPKQAKNYSVYCLIDDSKFDFHALHFQVALCRNIKAEERLEKSNLTKASSESTNLKTNFAIYK